MRTIALSKARLIAEHYCQNGLNKTKALQAAGYSKKYAGSSRGHALFDRGPVKDACSKLLARSDQLALIEVEEVVGALRELAFAEEGVTNADRIRSLDLLGRYLGMYREGLFIEQPERRQLDANEMAEAKAIARIRLERGDLLGEAGQDPEAVPADSEDPGGSGDGKTDPPLTPQRAGGIECTTSREI